MPGTVFEMELDEALAIVAAAERDPEFLWDVTDKEMLLAEARRVVEHAALEAAHRHLAPLFPLREPLKLIRGDKP
jgi:hypothetical protein